MARTNLSDLPVWKKLEAHAQTFEDSQKHLRTLLEDTSRIDKFALKTNGLFYDFSRQRVDEKAMDLLCELADILKLKEKFAQMVSGEKINNTENRAVLHTATRSFSNDSIEVDGVDIMPEMYRVRSEIKAFSEKFAAKSIVGSTGKPLEHVVVIGIGGSYLGPEFVSTALAAYAKKDVQIHYVANVDIQEFGRIAKLIDPETTLWVVISKSYTTAETTANTVQAYELMKTHNLDPAKHVVTVTAKGSPGDDPTNPVLGAFHMFDFIGGRYSVTSAVGGIPLSLYIGYDKFESFLKGAECIDQHTLNTPINENISMVSALISIWNNNFLGYQNLGIIPYAAPLSKLAPHVQQLYMESNGKYVDKNGNPLSEATGVIVFGEPGTNAQHSFFQLAHQGRPFPIDFIGAIKSQFPQYQALSKGVTNHQELWANLIAQPMALAIGKDDSNGAKFFPGNRPSSCLILDDLEPASIGKILALYEARTVLEAFVWNINPFDQFGVELGKKLANGIRNEMAEKNKNPGYPLNALDQISNTYLKMLFNQ